MAQMAKNPPAVQETQVQSLGWENSLKKRMAIHSSILTWKIPRTEEPGGLQSVGLQGVRHDSATNTHTHTDYYQFIIICYSTNKHVITFE